MKRHGNLFEKIITPENIYKAYKRARKGKSRLRGVILFERNEERNLEQVRQMLIDKTFTTAKYQEKLVYEPKKRTIYVLPFAPDRIVQHALMNVLIPIWEPLFIRDSYACIEGRGIHEGSKRTMQYIRRNTFCLKCDISKFYPSIDQRILMEIVERKIKCKDTLWLLNDIITSFPGGKNTPIGNLTSQWFGNLYMNELDQFVKHELKVDDYIRYCDDFLFFENDKKKLNEIAKIITAFLHDKLELKLSKCDLFHVSQGVDFLGYRHFRDYILLRKSTAKRVLKSIKTLKTQYERGFISAVAFRSKVSSAYGWMKWANTYNLQQKLKIVELMEFSDGLCKLEEARKVQ